MSKIKEFMFEQTEGGMDVLERVSGDDTFRFSDERMDDVVFVKLTDYERNKWISVKDRLPPYILDTSETMGYICCEEDTDLVYVAHYMREDGDDGNAKYFWWCEALESIEEPTHWMPLPVSKGLEKDIWDE